MAVRYILIQSKAFKRVLKVENLRRSGHIDQVGTSIRLTEPLVIIIEIEEAGSVVNIEFRRWK
jgi:hypothetical protein